MRALETCTLSRLSLIENADVEVGNSLLKVYSPCTLEKE
jgi:hypothetical protein